MCGIMIGSSWLRLCKKSVSVNAPGDNCKSDPKVKAMCAHLCRVAGNTV